MYTEIAAIQGANTSNAVMITRPSHNGAVAFCREYSRDYSQKCINDGIREQKFKPLTADCRSRVFVSFYGGPFRFLGRNRQKGQFDPDFIIQDIKTGETLDGSAASNYSEHFEVFKRLCPAAIR